MNLNQSFNKPPQQLQLTNDAQKATAMDMNNEAIRLLAASGPLIGAGLPGMPNGLGPAPPSMDNPTFRAIAAQAYPMFSFPPELNPDIMAQLPNGLRNFYMDPRFSPYPIGLDGARRKNATREVTAPLKQWLNEHRKNPYPTKGDKVMLAMITSMSMTQVSTWFANARRRLKKENKMTWSPRNRLSDEDGDDGNDRPTSSLSDISTTDDKKEHDETSTSTTNLTLPTVETKAVEGRESVASDSPRKLNNVSTASSKIWSIADTLGGNDGHVKEEKVEKSALDTSGSSLSSSSAASASTSVTSPPVSTATSTGSGLTPNCLGIGLGPGGLPMPPVMPPGSLPPGFPATPFPFLNPIQQQMMAAMMASNARLPLMPNPFQAMLAQQQQQAAQAAQAALRMPGLNTSMGPMAQNLFLNPLLMQTFGLGGLGGVPGSTSGSDDGQSPKENGGEAKENGVKSEETNKNGSTSNGPHAPVTTSSAHSSRSNSPQVNGHDLSMNGPNASLQNSQNSTNPAANLNLLSQS